MIRAIIFDFDYTLGDSTNGIALSINYALEKLGYSAQNIVDIKKTIGLSLKDTYKALTLKDNLAEAEQFAALFKEKADEVMVANTQLYDGVEVVLKKLKAKGCKIGIVTTKFHYRIEQILNKFGMSEWIDLIVGAEDVKIAKPDPEGLLWAVEHLGIAKDEILYVEDSHVDARTAENASVNFAGVLTGTTSKETFKKYQSVFLGENILDIYHFISAWNEKRPE